MSLGNPLRVYRRTYFDGLGLTGAHAGLRRLRSHFRATLAAGGANEAGFEFRQPNRIEPALIVVEWLHR